MILVPATMKLMGHANWSLPAWLGRILPEIEIEHAPAIKPTEEPALAPAS